MCKAQLPEYLYLSPVFQAGRNDDNSCKMHKMFLTDYIFLPQNTPSYWGIRARQVANAFRIISST